MYPFVIIHIENIDMLEFDDKSDRNWRFSFRNLGIIFNSVSAQHFPPGRMGNSAVSKAINWLMLAKINRCIVQSSESSVRFRCTGELVIWSFDILTHRGRDKLAAILQATFSNTSCEGYSLYKPMVTTVETLYSTIYHSKYFIELNFLISLHSMLPFELTKDTPYLALSGELWSVFYEYFNRNWSCYKGFLLY